MYTENPKKRRLKIEKMHCKTEKLNYFYFRKHHYSCEFYYIKNF